MCLQEIHLLPWLLTSLKTRYYKATIPDTRLSFSLFHPPERSCPQSVCPQWLPVPPEVMKAQKLSGETWAHVQVQTIPVKSSWINCHEKPEPESYAGQELLPQPGTGSRHTKMDEERAEQLPRGWPVRELHRLHAARSQWENCKWAVVSCRTAQTTKALKVSWYIPVNAP